MSYKIEYEIGTKFYTNETKKHQRTIRFIKNQHKHLSEKKELMEKLQ